MVELAFHWDFAIIGSLADVRLCLTWRGSTVNSRATSPADVDYFTPDYKIEIVD